MEDGSLDCDSTRISGATKTHLIYWFIWFAQLNIYIHIVLVLSRGKITGSCCAGEVRNPRGAYARTSPFTGHYSDSFIIKKLKQKLKQKQQKTKANKKTTTKKQSKKQSKKNTKGTYRI